MPTSDGFRSGFASGADPLAAAATVAEQLQLGRGSGSLGIVYLGDRWADHIEPILEILKRRTGVPDWIGTLGVGVIGGSNVAFDRPGIAAMTTPWTRDHYSLFDAVPDEGWHPAADGRLATAIVHADHRNRGLEAHLRSLSADSGAYLIGGVTMSRLERFDQIAGTLTDGGVSGVLLSPEIVVTATVSHGFQPVGPVRTVTEASGTIIRELDGNKPFNVMLADFSVSEISDLGRVGAALYVGLPVSASGPGSDFLVRAVTGVDGTHGALMIDHPIEAGQRILFCQRNPAGVADDLAATAEHLRHRAGRVRGALYVACVERGPNLFASAIDEVQIIQRALGDVPLVGFYSRGEIARDRLYKYAGVLALF